MLSKSNKKDPLAGTVFEGSISHKSKNHITVSFQKPPGHLADTIWVSFSEFSTKNLRIFPFFSQKRDVQNKFCKKLSI